MNKLTKATLNKSSNDTVLVQLEKDGYKVKYGCRSGFCGDCKIKVLSGSVSHIDEAIGVHEYTDGERLSCISRITSENAVLIF